MKKVDVNFMGQTDGKKTFVSRRGAFCELYPLDAGKEFNNRLLVLPFAPGRMRMFKSFIPEDKWTIRIPIKAHYLLSENEDGEIQRTMFLCRREMTQDFITSFGNGDYFGTKCGLCEQADKIRMQYDDRRKELGLYKSKLQKEEYVKRVKADDILNSLYQRQMKFRPSSRYLFVVFDLDKYEGVGKSLAEDEICQIQFLIVGKQIKDGIMTQVDAGQVFWDIDAGLHVVIIKKDTREGYAPDGILKSRYSVGVDPNVFHPDPNLEEYLKSEPFIDFSDYVELWDEGSGVVETSAGIQLQNGKEITPETGMQIPNEKETPSQTSAGIEQKPKLPGRKILPGKSGGQSSSISEIQSPAEETPKILERRIKF